MGVPARSERRSESTLVVLVFMKFLRVARDVRVLISAMISHVKGRRNTANSLQWDQMTCIWLLTACMAKVCL